MPAAVLTGDIMECSEAIEYIHSLEKFGINPGLERTEALCDILGNPQDKVKFIHVAGTNGKGSTSTMISNILIKSGYKTGLFISPYVADFRERIQFNGKMIEKDELAECVSEVKSAIEMLSSRGLQPTEFEAITAAAFLYFEKKKCDFAVLEVGLGGRLDSTNVIKFPCVSVITKISLDHTAILGDAVGKIAAEKCGIIKYGSQTVTYPFQDEEALRVIEKTCAERNNRLVIPDTGKLTVGEETLEGTSAAYDGVRFILPLAGRHMIYNACTAIEAVRSLARLGISVSDKAISEGIESTTMPARSELIKKNPVILLDGGHNEGCAEVLADFVGKHLSGKKIIMVCSMMADKDYLSYLRIVAPLASEFIASKAANPRALDAQSLSESANRFCKNCRAIPNPVTAVETALNELTENCALLVCGSFYLAGEVRNILLDF